jgi:hypothetical protein
LNVERSMFDVHLFYISSLSFFFLRALHFFVIKLSSIIFLFTTKSALLLKTVH